MFHYTYVRTYIKSLHMAGISSWPSLLIITCRIQKGLSVVNCLLQPLLQPIQRLCSSVINSDRHPPLSNTCIYSLFGTASPHVTFKCKNYYRLRGEIHKTFVRQIDFFADSPNFNPFKLRHLWYLVVSAYKIQFYDWVRQN